MPNVPTTNLNAYYGNTSPGNTINSGVIDTALQDIVQAINDNFALFTNFVNPISGELLIPDQTIVTRHIRNAAITNPKYAPLSVTADKIADGSITLTKLADLVVTAAKIANGTITTEKLADFSVTREKIAQSAVGANQLDGSLFQLYPDASIRAEFDKRAVNVQKHANLVVDGYWDAAIDAALAESKYIRIPSGIYDRKTRMVINGHVIIGDHKGDTFYNAARSTVIRFSNMPAVESCIHNEIEQSYLQGLLFEYDTWNGSTPEINGLTLARGIHAVDCGWNAFPGHGALLYRSQTSPDFSPYHSVFEHCSFDYNKKHGVVIGNGANAVYLNHCFLRWSGSPAYKTAPSVLGVYDGIYFDGKISTLPAGLNFEPQGCIITGGDIAYNSRYGTNLAYCNDNTIIGGYYEGNLAGKDLAIGNSYGCNILNPMLAQSFVVTTIDTDPVTPTRNIFSYPNNIVARGKDFGNGILNAYNQYEYQMLSMVNPNGTYLSNATNNKDMVWDRRFGSSSGATVYFKDKVRMQAKFLTMGSESFAGTSDNYMLSPAGTTQGNTLFFGINNNQFTGMFVVDGTGGSTTATGFRIPANSSTSRSINAGGTVNASGADYAEYMRKSDGCGIIEKGQVCGINSDGELTDVWEQAISFVVKSSNPSYVGGDTWSVDVGEPPQQPTRDPDEIDEEGNLIKLGESDDEYFVRCSAYRDSLTQWEKKLDAERQKFDRIAFSGQVPVNIYNAAPGDYIIPVNNNDKISATAIKTPTLEQYLSAVGKVIAIESDGRARIIVKVS